MNTSTASLTAPRAEAELIARSLASSESSRGICPKCKGGESGEKSFLCSRDSGGIAYYICFRASCNFRGRVVFGPQESGGHEPKQKRTREFGRPLSELTVEQVTWFRNCFDINPGRDIYYCVEMGRYAHRIMGPKGQHRGWVLRDYGGDLTPKALSYPSKADEPFVAWHKGIYETTPVVVVEDILSGRKVADAGFQSVALLGTTLTFDIVYEILEVTDKIALALDRGTMELMLKYREKFEILFDRIWIWNLDRDLKWVPRTRIRKAIFDGATDFISDYSGDNSRDLGIADT